MQEELEHLDAFIRDLEDINGMKIRTLEYGPGSRALYFVKDKSERTEDLLGEFKKILEALQFHGKIAEYGQISGCRLWILHHINCRYKSKQRTADTNTGWRNQSFKLLRTGNGNETPILQSVEF